MMTFRSNLDLNMRTRTTQLTVGPEGSWIYGETTFRVAIDDEGGGEFVVVRNAEAEINIDPREWEALRDAIDQMVQGCE